MLSSHAQSEPNLEYKNKKTTIKRLVVMGDSLSDRGTLSKRKLFGFIPMSLILAFSAHTHNGKFTNAYTWDDDLGAMLASVFLAKHLEKQKNHHAIVDGTDIADAVIDHDLSVKNELLDAYHLGNDKLIQYKNRDFMRTYCEGGLTSADYRKDHVKNIGREASRHMLSTLADKRKLLLEDDAKKLEQPGLDAFAKNIIENEKKETLIIEWSGGNDLITVNDIDDKKRPSTQNANKAVNARIDNVEALIQSGYNRFVLFTLPDLSLTPRFEHQSTDERVNAANVCEYFNVILTDKCRELKYKYPNISLDVFDVNPTLRAVKENPDRFGFKDVTTPFVKSKDYKKYHGGMLSAQTYMFWDDIHPTNHTHAILANELEKFISEKYTFEAPESITNSPLKYKSQVIYEEFIAAYEDRLKTDKGSLFFGCFRRGNLNAVLAKTPLVEDADNIDDIYKQRLNDIIDHALNHGGTRTKSVLRKLGWLDKDNHISESLLDHSQLRGDRSNNIMP